MVFSKTEENKSTLQNKIVVHKK